jgi:hypothetical protein
MRELSMSGLHQENKTVLSNSAAPQQQSFGAWATPSRRVGNCDLPHNHPAMNPSARPINSGTSRR